MRFFHLSCLATKLMALTITVSGLNNGASDLTRTGDLLITSEMHYRLCYTSVVSLNIISAEEGKVNTFLKNPPWAAICGAERRFAKLQLLMQHAVVAARVRGRGWGYKNLCAYRIDSANCNLSHWRGSALGSPFGRAVSRTG